MAGVIDFGDLHWTIPPWTCPWRGPCCRRGPATSSSRSTARWTTARAAAARLRALTSGLAQEAYGRDVGDAQIEREGVRSLHSVVAR